MRSEILEKLLSTVDLSSLRIYAQTPPPPLCSRPSLKSLNPSSFTDADVMVVLSHVSEIVMMSNLPLLANSLNWDKWAIFRSERMFRWKTFSPEIEDERSHSMEWRDTGLEDSTRCWTLFWFVRFSERKLCKFAPPWLRSWNKFLLLIMLEILKYFLL